MTKKNLYKLIFIGTPAFAVPSLRALAKDEGFEIAAVITQPDKPIGRQQILTPPPVKTEAQKFNLPIHQANKISDLLNKIEEVKPDLIVVAAYSQMIPDTILNLPKHGCLNVHGSLLPKYRGASCVQAAILNGDHKTGITIMKMEKKLDAGPILCQPEIEIFPGDTTGSLMEKLAGLSAEILPAAIKKFISGEISAIAQDDSLASYAKEIKKEDGRVDWREPAEKIARLIRAMSPWPGAWTTLQEKQIIIKQALVSNSNDQKRAAGEIFSEQNKLLIKCGRQSIIVLRLQLEGKKEMAAEEFTRGREKFIGARLI